MKRIELFEFEDFDWLPELIRAGATNLLVVFHKLMGTADVLANLILSIRNKHNFSQMVDLGSGSGGAMPDVLKLINESAGTNQSLKLILTDLYPNPKFVEEINNRQLANVEYYSTPINAINNSEMPVGLKTMIASFHHMKPKTAQKILQSAEKNKEPILIYEVAKNTVPVLLWWLLLPLSLVILFLMSLVMTPFIKPLTFSQLFFTYLIPIIPIVYAWDGQASLMRTYTFKDIEGLLGNKNSEVYEWTINDALKPNGKKMGYYVLGCPKN